MMGGEVLVICSKKKGLYTIALKKVNFGGKNLDTNISKC